MDRAPIIALVSFAGAEVCALLALWLRLRRRTLGERLRRRTVVDLAEAVVPGARLEWDERTGDGDRLRLRIVHAPAHEGDPAE
ncbi:MULTISPECIES: hypothetical protein [Streptomyces]|uniref:Uncharacterized protein n=2 Tax=Streptomyces TaxID=1883 RepID=A0A2U9NWX4_STRAS|nr:hypothetical protein [Streptomyces actuosus]AWT41822.1 hypothetical protein DMT42_05535 [Streptomyces actuosus]MBM4825572.1 hypothetical protein [Streptomyces actuosus]